MRRRVLYKRCQFESFFINTFYYFDLETGDVYKRVITWFVFGIVEFGEFSARSTPVIGYALDVPTSAIYTIYS